MIGRIGIGLLGVAQICHEFEVWSHHKESQTAFHGTVTIGDYLEEEIDVAEPSRTEDYPVGTYTCERIEYVPAEAGTTIVVTDVKRGFSVKHREQDRPTPPKSFDSFLKDCYAQTSITSFGDYWELIWGLSVQCPLPYMDGSPVDLEHSDGDVDEVRALLQELPNYDFGVIVDQVRLFSPVVLPNERAKGEPLPSTVHLFSIDEEVYGDRLHVTGYLVAQQRAVKPAELRGILVRIRGVGIGGYDKSFLNYSRRAEGPRLLQVSGELFVEAGLEDALNIDRDSFNEMHPHYIRLQDELHGRLPTIFDNLTKKSAQRSLGKRKREAKEARQRLTRRIRDLFGVRYKIVSASQEQTLPVVVDVDDKRILVDDEALRKQFGRRAELAAMVAIASAVADAHGEEDERQRSEFFLTLLREVL